MLSIKTVTVIAIFIIVTLFSCQTSTNPTGNSIYYNGTTYTGMGRVSNNASPRNTDSFDYISISKPTVKGFDADAFFTLNGGTDLTDDRQYVYMHLVKDGTDNSADYWGRGSNFSKMIWLRFGKGNYTFYVYNTVINVCGLGYEGEINSYGYTVANPVYIFNINNTRDEDGSSVYPSDVVQSYGSSVSDLASSIITDSTSDEDAIRKIHDFVVLNLYYDTASTVIATRKKQDAVNVLANKCAVCEGYTCLFMALCRANGFKTRAHISVSGSSSGAHAWASVYLNGSYFYVDPTLDDTGGTTPDSTSIKHEYFLFTTSTFHENNGEGNYIKIDW